MSQPVRIVISIEHGMVNVIQKPAFAEIIVWDYDVQEEQTDPVNYEPEHYPAGPETSIYSVDDMEESDPLRIYLEANPLEG
jgi:hypothetical protein